MDAELARVQLEEISRLSERSRLTFLLDGWEDKLKRSLYGALVAEVNQYPVVLSLSDMTGKRGSADALLKVAEDALDGMDIKGGSNLVAVTTDNPSVMRSFRKKFQMRFYWVLVSYWYPEIEPIIQFNPYK